MTMRRDGRVIADRRSQAGRAQWQRDRARSARRTASTQLVGGRFVVEYLQDARAVNRVYESDGRRVREVELPGIGTAQRLRAASAADAETFYAFASFNAPPTIYRYDVASGESSLFRRAKVEFDPRRLRRRAGLLHEQGRHARSRCSSPTSKGLKLDGDNPTLLYGYGGFNISLTPGFSVARLAWMEMGGVFALANLRGGGEYGEAWHEAGTKLHKQNVFDDFIAAARVARSPANTRARRSSRISGGSNGGLLVGAVHDAAARPVRRGAAGGRRDGHAALPPVHRRPLLGRRLRLAGQRRGVQGAATRTRRITTSARA